MKPLTAILALALSLAPYGCCVEDGTANSGERFSWEWRTGGTCFVPDRSHRDALEAGIALWAEMGVSFDRAEGDPDVELCLLPRHPRPGYPGWTSHPGVGGALVELNGLIAATATPAIYAHELGHVVLYPGTGHHTGTGILAPHVTLRLDWSPEDREFLAERGFGSDR